MPSLSDIKHSAIAGLLMISGGNALLTWAVEYISSGLAGILSATAPLYITFLSIYFFKGFRITWVIIGGLILSIGGIILLSKPENGLAMSPQFWTGFWLTISANLSWAMGTIYMKKHPIDQHVYLKTAMQMIPAALFNFVVSGFFERMPNLQAVKADGWWATIYLIFIGSLVGYTSFVYLIKHMSPARLSIHVYVNTLVAVILGWLLGGDHLTAWTWGAMLVVITGVFIVNNQYAKMAKVV